MNARQFLNTMVSAGLERYSGFRKSLNLLPRFLFPEFLKHTRLQIIQRPIALAVTIYVIVFFLVFVVQAWFAAMNDRLVPEGIDRLSCFRANKECLKFFFSDVANLVNYVVLVEAYCIAGVFFLIYSSNVDRLLSADKLATQLGVSEPPPSLAKGAFSVWFVIIFVTLGSVGYAVEIQSYPPHWYMNVPWRDAVIATHEASATIRSVPFSGGQLTEPSVWALRGLFYYVFINYLLLLFVGFVGVAHFGLFKTAGTIASGLRRIYDTCEEHDLQLLLDNDKVNAWLTPLSTQILISKIFVLAIVLNMTSWKMWEQSAGTMNDIAIVIMVIVGIWIVTLPRYFVQYHLFRIRRKCGVDEYRDIRMSWLLGASAMADVALLAIAGKILFSAESIFEMIGSTFAGG